METAAKLATGSVGPPTFDGKEPVQLQFSGGTYLAALGSNYIYNMNSSLGQHAVIELQVPLSMCWEIVGMTPLQIQRAKQLLGDKAEHPPPPLPGTPQPLQPA